MTGEGTVVVLTAESLFSDTVDALEELALMGRAVR